MSRNRPSNLSAFEPDQQRVIEGVYQLVNKIDRALGDVTSSRQSERGTSGSGDFLEVSDLSGDGDTTVTNNGDGTVTISSNDTITRVGIDSPSMRSGNIFLLAGEGMSITQIGRDVTFEATGTTYSAGSGLDLSGTEFSHSTPSPVASDSVNPDVTVIQSIEVDEFGHASSISSVNLDGYFLETFDVSGSGATSVTDNGDGTITVSSTDTDTVTKVGVDAGSMTSGDVFLLAGGGTSITQVGNDITIELNLSAGDIDSTDMLVDDVVTGSKIEDNTIGPGNMSSMLYTGNHTISEGDTISVENGIILGIAT